MYEKKCSACYKYSYSGASLGIWICPYCQSDITKVKAKKANHRRITGKIYNVLARSND